MLTCFLSIANLLLCICILDGRHNNKFVLPGSDGIGGSIRSSGSCIPSGEVDASWRLNTLYLPLKVFVPWLICYLTTCCF